MGKINTETLLLRMDTKLDTHGVKLAKIEEHLLNLNGKVASHETKLGVECVRTHKITDERIELLKNNQTKIFTAKTILLAVGVVVMQVVALFIAFYK